MVSEETPSRPLAVVLDVWGCCHTSQLSAWQTKLQISIFFFISHVINVILFHRRFTIIKAQQGVRDALSSSLTLSGLMTASTPASFSNFSSLVALRAHEPKHVNDHPYLTSTN